VIVSDASVATTSAQVATTNGEEPAEPKTTASEKPADSKATTSTKPAELKTTDAEFCADEGSASMKASSTADTAEPTTLTAPATTFTPAPFDSCDNEEYLAICVSVKDQYLDLLEWLTHHYHHHNVRRFYLMDDGSNPLLATLNYSTAVDPRAINHRYCHPATRLFKHQLVAYDECIALFGHKHKWMAFLDADEFIEVRGKDTLHSMLLKVDGDDKIGALAVN